MTEKELRMLVVNMANHYAEIGTVEGGPTCNKLIEIYNEHKPLARGVKYSYDIGGWCGVFVSDMFILTGLSSLIVTECGAWEFKDNARKAKQWKARGTYIPKSGDIIVYSYRAYKQDGTAYTQYHVGIVTNADASVIYTTEGNVSDRVLMLRHDPDDKTIEGFWSVDYASLVQQDPEGIPAEPGTYVRTGIRSASGEWSERWEKK